MTNLIYTASYELKEIPELSKMGPPVINLVWEFAYPSGASVTVEDYL
jgi:hypothetical protein